MHESNIKQTKQEGPTSSSLPYIAVSALLFDNTVQ